MRQQRTMEPVLSTRNARSKECSTRSRSLALVAALASASATLPNFWHSSSLHADHEPDYLGVTSFRCPGSSWIVNFASAHLDRVGFRISSSTDRSLCCLAFRNDFAVKNRRDRQGTQRSDGIILQSTLAANVFSAERHAVLQGVTLRLDIFCSAVQFVLLDVGFFQLLNSLVQLLLHRSQWA